MSYPGTWNVVRGEAERIPALSAVPDGEVQNITDAFVQRFVADRSTRWWWDALRAGPGIAIHYDDEDPAPRIAALAPARAAYVLLVTDEEPEPAGAFRGPLTALDKLVGESPYFEYLVTDEDATFGIFDTHHNMLICVGDIRLETTGPDRSSEQRGR
jgi:hypothetical protein